MLFWTYMLFVSSIIPVILISFGLYFRKNAPKNINYIFGYRTARSMKNKDTWLFAHNFCGKIWLIGGIIVLILSIAIMLSVINMDTDTIGYVGAGCSFLSIILIIISVFFTENALKKKFNIK